MILLNTIIYYDNYKEIETYCKEVYHLANAENIYISICVNKMGDKQKSEIEKILGVDKKIHIYFPNNNEGYMNGMLFAYEQFTKETKLQPDYIIMSNTDIQYPDKEFLSKFIRKDYGEDIWGIAPSVYALRRLSYDNPVSYTRLTIGRIKRTILFTSLPIVRSLYVWLSEKKARIKKTKEQSSSYIYLAHGCYFIIKRELAEVMSKHKYGVLLYSEEAYVAEEIYHHNKKMYYDSDLKIIHAEHSTTGKLKYARVAKYISSSLSYILKEYYDKQ